MKCKYCEAGNHFDVHMRVGDKHCSQKNCDCPWGVGM